MAPHSSVPAWEIPLTEEPGGLQAMGSPTVGRDRAANIHRLCIISPCSVTRQRLWKSEWEGPRRVSRTAGRLERWGSGLLVVLLRHWSAPQLDPPTSNRQRAARWRVCWACGGPAPSGGLCTESKVRGHFWPSTPDPPVHRLCASRWAVGGELGAAGPGDRLGIVFCRALEPSAGEGNGTPLQSSPLENPMDGGAWWAAVHGVAKSRTRLSVFTFTFHFHALEKEMATHSSVLAWRIPGKGEPGGLPSMGSHSVGHDGSALAAAAEPSARPFGPRWSLSLIPSSAT